MNRIFLFLGCGIAAMAQMTAEQRVFDFQALVASLNRNYAPYEWKRELFGFDMLDLKPWMERVRTAPSDLEYFEVVAEYMSSLRDTHTSYRIPSIFSATTGLHLDIYDAKVIVDSINRTTLPLARYSIAIGDEVLAVDGKPAAELVNFYRKYSYSGNESAARRQAALRFVSRPQSVIPRAHEIGESVKILVRHANGEEEEYTIPWIKFGDPLLKVGPVPSPVKTSKPERRSVEEEAAPDYLKPLFELARDGVDADESRDVLNYGSLVQVWAWPASAGYTARAASVFRAGTFRADGLRIGYIRIPNFSPPSTAAALAELEAHIQFFNENTDGLVIDVMRNNGGNACYNEDVQRRLIPYTFRGLGRELRANRNWLNRFSGTYYSARANNADTWIIQLYEILLNEMRTALTENRARTGPVPICSPSLDRTPANVTYSKPLMVITDEFSTSAADGFPAALQDARRGPIFGKRSNGAGGTVLDFASGVFSEASSRATVGMHHRQRPVTADGYPTSSYVENVGVHPDIPYEFMTVENLMNGGRPFVEAFSKAIADHIRSSR
ncbi:MAG: hypothetical protein FJW32_21140 [Acidobacteria bacterium]|nr:hypothetical protein [Acidobacteriota bacterium]